MAHTAIPARSILPCVRSRQRDGKPGRHVDCATGHKDQARYSESMKPKPKQTTKGTARPQPTQQQPRYRNASGQFKPAPKSK